MSDILSAIGILLAITTLFYDKTTALIRTVLNKSLPTSSQEIELNNAKKEIKNTIYKSLIYNFIFIVFFFLLLPTSVEIMKKSTISLWHFELIETIFIIFNLVVLVFIIIAGKGTIKLLNKLKKCMAIISI